MEVFKNIWLTIGSIAIALVIVFCVGMLTPKFREKVYNLAQVQPSSNVEEKTMEINNLQEEINSYKAQIASLTQERTTLSNQMLALNGTNSENEELIEEYTVRINELNAQINHLQDRLTRVSANVSNATVSFVRTNSHTFMPFYDIDGQYKYHSGYHDVHDLCLIGQDLKVQLTGNNPVELGNLYAADKLNKAIKDDYELYAYDDDEYMICIANDCFSTCFNSRSFYFDRANAIATQTILFNGQVLAANELIDSIEDDKYYNYSFTMSYELNANNEIIHFIFYHDINEI